MKRLTIQNFLSDDQLKSKLNNAKTSAEFKRWQCLYLIKTQNRITAEYLSNILCISKPSVYLYVQSYNKNGIQGIIPKTRGGRKRAYLTNKEESKLLKILKQRVLHNDALSMKDMKHWIEGKIGHIVSNDYMWDLFHRHNWEKKTIIYNQTKIKKTGQIVIQKNLKTIWMPS
jgi:transposase